MAEPKPATAEPKPATAEPKPATAEPKPATAEQVSDNKSAEPKGGSQIAKEQMTKAPELIDEQLKACVKLKEFLQDKDKTNFLLLGPAGSGKTTVIVNAFTTEGLSQLKVVFCAFTNKATQVLRNISRKIHDYTEGRIKLNADFLTIHKLLSLEVKMKEAEDEIGFTFEEKEMMYLNSSDADVIVFDECSTISKELFGYIKRAWDYIFFLKQKKLKLIFLGDFWQLPPISEESSVVFESVRSGLGIGCPDPFGWTVAKLKKVMRAANPEMKALNDSCLRTIELLSQKKFNEFWQSFPYGIIPGAMFRSNAEIIDAFFELDSPGTGLAKKTTMVLTFSNANCLKINHAIQDFIDQKQNREPVKERKAPIFFPGDRCCVERPIEIREIKRDEAKLKIGERVADDPTPPPLEDMCRFGHVTGQMIYNGEVLEVLAVEEIKIVTSLNTLRGTPKYFPAQLLYVKRLDDESLHEIVNIDKDLVNKCRPIIRRSMTKDGYLGFMSEFYSYVPLLNYGYCITIYKAQGSEWDNVICNISSIEASIVREGVELNATILTRLFKTTYTAITRAREKVVCLYLTGRR